MNDPDAFEEAPQSPWLVRFGATVGIASLASLVAAIPGALRLSASGDVTTARAWLFLAGSTLIPMIALLPIARLARDGLRGVITPDGHGGALERVAAASLFACTWLWFLSALGASLREKTHQRALGAVTFAILALAAGVFIAFAARRLATVLRGLSARRPPIGTTAASLVTGLALGLLGLRVVRAAPFLSPSSRSMLIDGLALALCLAFAAQKTLENRRIASRLGPPVAVGILVVMMHTLVTQTAGVAAIERVCPLYFALLAGYGHLSL